jgi:L-fuconolactonase
LRRAFLPEDLRPLLQETGVVQSVLVQAQASLDETYWFLRLAEANYFIAGVVGWVDITAPDLAEVLDKLMQHPKFKGVRHQVEDEPDEAWLNRPDVLRGFKELARRNLPYDLLIKPKHLRYIPAIAEQIPELRMVVDHIAKPAIVLNDFDNWARDFAVAARIPNVWCKLSGMITEADWRQWKPSDLKPYIDYLIEHFGFDRLMFGSDWPVCLLAGTYKQVFEALDENLSGINDSQKAKIFGGNAQHFYNLNLD